MTQTFGNFIDFEAGAGEYLKIGFKPSSIPLQQRWRNNGLSADFLAGYVSTFFPGDDPISSERQAEIKDAISFIANEVLENAMKFSYASHCSHMVSIEMFLEADAVSLYTSNCIDPDKIAPFQAYIQRLLTEDPDALYMEQLERNADDDAGAGSGLGFLTMINDYSTTLAWRFSAHGPGPENVTVTTMVHLAV